MRAQIIIAAAIAASSSSSFAQPAKAQAEVLFKQGKELMGKKKFAEACDAFDASQRLDPSLATALNQADCREKNGQLATAYGLFLTAQQQARGSGDPNAGAMQKVAGERAGKLEARLSKLTITVTDAQLAGLVVKRNGEPVDRALWNRALPVDGGTSKIEASAPNVTAWSESITVANEGDNKTITIPALTATKVDPPKVDPPKVVTPVTPTEAPKQSKVVPIALAASAGVLAIGAVVLEFNARSIYADAEKEVDDTLQESLWKKSNTRRYLSQGLAAGAIVCAGLAVWRFIASGKTEPSPADGVALAPTVTSGFAGFVVDGRF